MSPLSKIYDNELIFTTSATRLQMAYENILLVVILAGAVLFGAKKLPEYARSLGKAKAEFEKARMEGETMLNDTKNKMME